MSSEKTLWTVMIYIAADNDLASDAWNNVVQMMTVAQSPVFEDDVRLVFQLDLRDPTVPTRRFFRRGSFFGNERVGTKGETNTGDPQTLIDFITWAHRNNPAQNYLLILWGHANGTDDEDTVVNLNPLDITPTPPAITPAPTPSAPPTITALAASGNATALTASENGNDAENAESKQARRLPRLSRSALPDENTGNPAHPLDALTSFELRAALEAAHTILGRKISVLGMDACLLSMIEICYQVSEFAELYVGSEEVIPNTSWPYDRILSKLAARPSMQPSELAETIVDEYIAVYNEKTGAARKQVTLSFCDLGLADDLGKRVSDFSALLQQKLSDPKLKAEIIAARRKAQTFFITDYVDLHHFCQLVRDKTADENLRSACQQVMDGIKQGFVRKVAHTKLEDPAAVDVLANTNGLSVYFPLISHTYTSLKFSQQTRWDSFLNGYMNALFQPTGEAAESNGAGTGSSPGLPPTGNAAVDISGSQIPATAGVGSHHLDTGGTIVMNEKIEDSTATPTSVTSPETGKGEGSAYAGTGLATATATEEAPPVPASKKARIVLPIDSTIGDSQGNEIEKLPDEAFLLFEDQIVVIEVPEGTPLVSTSTPGSKASKGTETKATIGTRIVPSLGAEIRLPACTLWKPLTDGSLRELYAGTVVKTALDGAQIVILDEVAVKGF